MSTQPTDLVTGATGLLGSHIVDRLLARGRSVRALARPGADTRRLESLGVAIVRGDLNDPAACRLAVEGVQNIYHSAAKVGDWGPWRDFQSGCIDATRNLAEAALQAAAGRLIHISSTSAYGHPRDGSPPIDESEPMGQNVWLWDHYTRSKVESEQTLWRLRSDRGLRVSVIRPSWLYGERDRTTLARLVTRLRAGKVPLIGRGDNPLSAIYAGNVADAALLAADTPAAEGQAYNVTNMGRITQREFLSMFAEAAGAPAIRRSVPYPLAFAAAFVVETAARCARSPRPPFVTRYAAWLMGRNLEYSNAKAERELSWRPAVGYRESIERSVRWYLHSTTTGA
ncbi:MAG: NAD-dependent epimerase/dehydratase family protein [Planctomycetota bacterium]|nr:NAD-dependent epimerase/dehydratase family protein [Planctomycetota bacterium]